MTEGARKNLNDMLERLEKLTAELVTTQSALIECGEQKRDALVNLDMKGVKDANSTEAGLLQVFVNIQSSRIHTLAALAAPLGVDTEDVNLAAVAERVEEPMKGRLEELREQVLVRVELLEKLTRLNRVLTEQSMKHVDGFLKAITDAVHQVPTYERGGSRSESSDGNLMIDQVA